MLKALRALTPFALLIGMLMTAPAHAQKIGVVDFARLVQESPQFMAMVEMLEAEFAPRQREILSLQQELQEKQQRYERDREVLSDQERATLERELRDGAREFQRQGAEFEEDFNIRRNEEIGTIQRSVLEAVQAYAREERYDLIVGEALYFDSDLDITAAVLDELDN
jgi:outer membrane protein